MFDKYLCRSFSEKEVTVGTILQNMLEKDTFVLGVAIMGACAWVAMCAGGALPLWAVIFTPVVGAVFGVFMYVVGWAIAQIMLYFLSIKVAECPLKKESEKK